MTDPRRVLRAAGLSAKKSFGQNFLVAEHIVKAIAAAAVPDPEVGRAAVIEIGAGTGVLTAALHERAAHVIAIERDRDLLPLLRERFPEGGRVQLLEADAQTVPLEGQLPPSFAPHVLAGNLPYQLTGRLLTRAMELHGAFARCIFMVQSEVAARLGAKPRSKEYGALTVFIAACFDVKRVSRVSPHSFFPVPDVASEVVQLTPVVPRRAVETATFRALVRGAFEQRRKTLRNAWGRVAPLPALEAASGRAGISLTQRGEELDVEAFARMATSLDEG